MSHIRFILSANGSALDALVVDLDLDDPSVQAKGDPLSDFLRDNLHRWSLQPGDTIRIVEIKE